MQEPLKDVVPENLRKAHGKLVLNSDGTFTASDVPGLCVFETLLPFAKDHPLQLDNGRGTWKIGNYFGEQSLYLTFNYIDDWDAKELPFVRSIEISMWPSSDLHFELGDPDSNKRIVFLKAPASS